MRAEDGVNGGVVGGGGRGGGDGRGNEAEGAQEQNEIGNPNDEEQVPLGLGPDHSFGFRTSSFGLVRASSRRLLQFWLVVEEEFFAAEDGPIDVFEGGAAFGWGGGVENF